MVISQELGVIIVPHLPHPPPSPSSPSSPPLPTPHSPLPIPFNLQLELYHHL
ncbi:hypothetical protein [Nostoc sp. CHAB 5715]|uniref:hypothetical protein n=1 Tax=Nostoc sp. CHAB 5715 TaxID=2780400 RepID=UPI001E4D63E3|nr:hypothetical protein [Nostoc sp. CHAB 5715]MCC5621693.1 hypothetical protein [Nostoc sp. CHAB 5715]